PGEARVGVAATSNPDERTIASRDRLRVFPLRPRDACAPTKPRPLYARREGWGPLAADQFGGERGVRIGRTATSRGEDGARTGPPVGFPHKRRRMRSRWD